MSPPNAPSPFSLSPKGGEGGGEGIAWQFLLAVALLFYGCSCWARIHQSVGMDEIQWLVAVRHLYHGEAPRSFFFPGMVAYSPHLYLYLIHGAVRVFGFHEWAIRLVGIFSGVVTLFLVFILTQSLIRDEKSGKQKWGTVTLLLLATSPAFIQGSVILDIDNTILIPLTLFLLGFFLKYEREPGWKWGLALTGAVTLSYWGRITTPTVVIFLLSVYLLGKKLSWKTRGGALGSFLMGFLLFLFLWFVYCRITGMPFSMPFAYTLQAFQYRAFSPRSLNFVQVLENLVYLVLWVGPFSFALFLLLAGRRLGGWVQKRDWSAADLLLGVGIFLVGGYTFVGGSLFGFPKYHLPGLPLLLIFSGTALHRERLGRPSLPASVFVVIFAFLIQVLTLGDPLYLLRYELREALLLTPSVPPGVLKEGALKTGFYLLSFAALFVFCQRSGVLKNGMWFILLAALGTNLGLNFFQNTKGYQTGYNYGAGKTLQAVQFIRERTPRESQVLVPAEILYYLDRPSATPLFERAWNDPKVFLNHLKEPRVWAFACSVITNPVNQIKALLNDPPLRSFLGEKFEEYRVGDFQIWIRRGEAISD